MEKVIILKEHEAKEIGAMLSRLLCEERKQIARGNEPLVNIKLLEHYKKFLWGN